MPSKFIWSSHTVFNNVQNLEKETRHHSPQMVFLEGKERHWKANGHAEFHDVVAGWHQKSQNPSVSDIEALLNSDPCWVSCVHVSDPRWTSFCLWDLGSTFFGFWDPRWTFFGDWILLDLRWNHSKKLVNLVVHRHRSLSFAQDEKNTFKVSY